MAAFAVLPGQHPADPDEGQFGGHLALYEGTVFAAAEANLANEDVYAFESGVSSVVAVDGAVFATTVDGGVVSLR